MTPRVLVVALDAAAPDLVLRWADAGLLPTFARLAETSLRGAIENAPGIYTGAVWPSFCTGLGPGRHGGYYEDQLLPGTYRIEHRLPCESGGEQFWDVLARAGRRVCAFDVPKSWVSPGGAEVQVCNWGTHDAETPPCSWPPALAGEIDARFGGSPFRRCDWVARGPEPEATLLRALNERIARKVAIAEDLLARAPWDLFLVGFGDSHCAGHQLWHVHDPTHPRHDPALAARLGDPLLAVYRALDAALARLLTHAGPETTTIVVLSHGMSTHYDATYLLDDILRAIEGRTKPPGRGLLDRLRDRWRRLPVAFTERFHGVARRLYELPDGPDRAARRCFAVPTNANCAGIRINLAGREPAGRVRPGAELDAFRRDLIAELHALVDADDGRPLVREVLDAAQLFPGERSHVLPDLLVRWNREAPIRGAASPRIGRIVREDTNTRRSGDHRPDGSFLACGPGVLAPGRADAAIEDFAPTVAALLGVALEDVDGVPIAALVGQASLAGASSVRAPTKPERRTVAQR